MQNYRYLYGPVPSRRLGISLGVDMVPHKVCSLNCIYCECGRTTNLTLERQEYHKIDAILDEIEDYLSKQEPPDFLTLSGAGEPTLNAGIGRLIREIKARYSEIKVAVLTNSTLLTLPEVRKELLAADVVLPSLDGVLSKEFLKVDRPHPSIDLEALVQGIKDFIREFKTSADKEVWLEIFFAEGINTSSEHSKKLREVLADLKPDKIQLNTLDRPGTEDWVKPVSQEFLQKVKEELNLPGVEIIHRYQNRKEIQQYRELTERTILKALELRPLTREDLMSSLGIHPNELDPYLEVLEKEKRIHTVIQNRGVFYRVVR